MLSILAVQRGVAVNYYMTLEYFAIEQLNFLVSVFVFSYKKKIYLRRRRLEAPVPRPRNTADAMTGKNTLLGI